MYSDRTLQALEGVNEKHRIALRLQFDLSLADQERLKAAEKSQELLIERISLERNLENITLKQTLDKELATQQEERKRAKLYEQLDAAEGARSSLAQYEQEEANKRRERDAEALSSIATLSGKQKASSEELKESADSLRDRVELIAEAQSDVEREIAQSTAELKRLNAEFEKTTDPRKAGRLVEQMNDTTKAIEESRSEMEQLVQQRLKAEDAAKREAAAAEEAAHREMQAASQVEAQRRAIEAAREELIGKRQGQVGDQASALLNQDPRDVARTLAIHRTGTDTGRDFQRAFRQAMNQANGGRQSFSPQEIADALQSNVQTQIQSLRQSGEFDQETIAALTRATNEQIAQGQELAAMQQQLDAINKVLQANADKGQARRGRLGRGAN
jgi:hypothetical protein